MSESVGDFELMDDFELENELKTTRTPANKKEITQDPKRTQFAKDAVGKDSTSNTLLDLVRSAVGQGFLQGTGDEIEGGLVALGKGVVKGELPDYSLYQEERDKVRDRMKRFKDENPVLAHGSEIAGGLASMATPLGVLGKGVKGAAALGALSGLGSSEAELFGDKSDLTGTATDIALGGTIGGAATKYPKLAAAALAGAGGAYLADKAGLIDKEDPLSAQNALVGGGLAAGVGTGAYLLKKFPKTDTAKAFKAGREGIPLTSGAEMGARQAVDIDQISHTMDAMRKDYIDTLKSTFDKLGDIAIDNPFSRNQEMKDRFFAGFENKIKEGKNLNPNLKSLFDKPSLTPVEYLTLDDFGRKLASGEGTGDMFTFMKGFRQHGEQSGLSGIYKAKEHYKDIATHISDPVIGEKLFDLDNLSKEHDIFSGIGKFVRDSDQETKNALLAKMSSIRDKVGDWNPELGNLAESTIDKLSKTSEESRLHNLIGGGVPSAPTISKLATKVAGVPAWGGFQTGVLTKEAADVLSNTPGVSHLGKALSKALADGDRNKQTAIQFLIKQTSEARKALGMDSNDKK